MENTNHQQLEKGCYLRSFKPIPTEAACGGFFTKGKVSLWITFNRKTFHDYASISRYINAFIKVVGFLENEGLNRLEIRKILGCSLRLVDKYIELYHQFNTPEYKWWMSKIRKMYNTKGKKK